MKSNRLGWLMRLCLMSSLASALPMADLTLVNWGRVPYFQPEDVKPSEEAQFTAHLPIPVETARKMIIEAAIKLHVDRLMAGSLEGWAREDFRRIQQSSAAPITFG